MDIIFEDSLFKNIKLIDKLLWLWLNKRNILVDILLILIINIVYG